MAAFLKTLPILSVTLFTYKVEVPAVSLMWVAYWYTDKVGGKLATCSDGEHSSPVESRPLGVQC